MDYRGTCGNNHSGNSRSGGICGRDGDLGAVVHKADRDYAE